MTTWERGAEQDWAAAALTLSGSGARVLASVHICLLFASS